MAWGIQKYDFLALAHNLICTNMLGNTASLSGGNSRATDAIQQGCLTMVNVSHYSNNWWTEHKALWIILNFRNLSKINLWWKLFYIYAEFGSHQSSCIKINILINGSHNTHQHKLLDDISGSTANLAGEILYNNGLSYLDILRTGNLHLRSWLLILVVAVVLVTAEILAIAVVVIVKAAAILKVIISVVLVAILTIADMVIMLHTVITLHTIISIISVAVITIITIIAIITAALVHYRHLLAHMATRLPALL